MSHKVYDPKKPNAIYLRPGPKSRPVKYLESIENSGMIIDGKHSIAMYTSRAGAIAGPAGPAGFDTIIASCSDEMTPITLGGPKTTFRAPYAFDMSNGYVRISFTTAPVGGEFIFDLHMNGVSMFSTLVTCDSGELTSFTAAVPSVIDIPGNLVPEDAEFRAYVNQVGSSVAGTGLKVAVTGVRA